MIILICTFFLKPQPKKGLIHFVKTHLFGKPFFLSSPLDGVPKSAKQIIISFLIGKSIIELENTFSQSNVID